MGGWRGAEMRRWDKNDRRESGDPVKSSSFVSPLPLPILNNSPLFCAKVTNDHVSFVVYLPIWRFYICSMSSQLTFATLSYTSMARTHLQRPSQAVDMLRITSGLKSGFGTYLENEKLKRM